jgi:hypothetical protein
MTELLTSVSALPKDIQRNIMGFLSMPTADAIRDELKQRLMYFLSLTNDERKKFDLFDNKSFNSSAPFRLNKLKGYGGVFNTYWFLIGNEYSHRILKNYGIMLIGGLLKGDRTYPYSRGGYTWDDIYRNTSVLKCDAKGHLKGYKDDLKWYLKKNQIEYKEKAQLKTLIKMVQDIPNSEGKYEKKTKKTIKSKKTKKYKLILVD